MFLPVPRATFLIPSGPPNEPLKKHLFVVLTQQIAREGQDVKEVLLVSFSSVRHQCDRTCVLGSKDHSFFNHDSFADYYFARIEEVKKLKNFEQCDPMSPEAFAKIVQGLTSSPHTTPKIRAFYTKTLVL